MSQYVVLSVAPTSQIMNYCMKEIRAAFVLFSRLIPLGVLAVFCLFPLRGLADDALARIDSVILIQAKPDHVEIEITSTYNGSLGRLNLKVIAKSTDGMVRSYGNWPVFLPIGQNQTTRIKIAAPSGVERQQTDVLLAKFYQNGKGTLQTQILNWQHVWPDLSDAPLPPDNGRPIALGSNKTRQAIIDTFAEDDFDCLDRILDQWNRSSDRDIDGELKLASFTRAMKSVFSNGDWRGNLQRMSKWKNKTQSIGASLAEAIYWSMYAMDARGNEHNEPRDPFRRKLFLERLKHAETILFDLKRTASYSPVWFEINLDVAILKNQDSKHIESIFSDAIQKHPSYLPLYLSIAKYWMRDDATSKDIDSLLRTVDKVSATSEYSYAQLFWQLTYELPLEKHLFKNSVLSWPTMKRSLETLLRNYPSAANINRLAFFSCQAMDRTSFLNIRPRLANHIINELWPSNYSPDLCDHRFLQSI